MNNMRTLIISIYDSGYNFNAAILDNGHKYSVDETYVKNLYKIYDDHMDVYGLINKAQSLNFDNVIICEDGGIIYKQF